MCTKYWLTACLKLAQEKSVVRLSDRPAMTIAVDLGRKATKQTKQKLPLARKRLLYTCQGIKRPPDKSA